MNVNGNTTSAAAVGVAIVGHGACASALVDAARGIVGRSALPDVVAIDAGVGETGEHGLGPRVCAAIERVDRGAGVLVLVDLAGASPCQCAQREGLGRGVVVLAGLNLAMLLKLAGLDLTSMTPVQLAAACGDSGQRAVAVCQGRRWQPQVSADKEGSG